MYVINDNYCRDQTTHGIAMDILLVLPFMDALMVGAYNIRIM